MPKYRPDTSHWDEDDEESEPEPEVEADLSLRVYDERDEIERYNGLEWWFLFNDEGKIHGVDVGHYCPGRGHIDPMGFVSWDDVPKPVRDASLSALNVDNADEIVDYDATREVAEVDYDVE